jgi:HEPN domain-containing protein
MTSLHQDFRPGRLWSLWDIMEPFQPALFMRLMEIAGIVRTQEQWRKAFPPSAETDLYDERTRALYDDLLAGYEAACIQLELVGSLASIRRMRTQLANSVKRSDMASLEVELASRLFDEMIGRSFWSLSSKEAERYKNPRNGWEEIITRFPDAVGDIEEASKCFALSRYAAAIFHSVQVVEIGLIALGKLIGVTDHLPGWTATTSRLQSIIKKGHEARTPFERQHFAFLEQMHGTIEGLKNAWRNKVSHAHGKLTLLTADFSPDVAEEILFATRAFMRRLATDAPVVSGGHPS